MAEESRLLGEIYDAQASIVIGRDLNYFTVPVDTDIGISKDENARFDALIQYALAKGKILDQNTLNHYDERWNYKGLKKALNAALPQASYLDEFQAYISGIKERESSAEELNQAAQKWLREKTSHWLDWQSIEADEILLDWMHQAIEDKPMTASMSYTPDDLVFIGGETKKWKDIIKNNSSGHARWFGRKLAWRMQFKAWQALLNNYPHAANELHLIS